MKKTITILLSAVLMLAGAAYAVDFTSVNKTEDFTVRTTIDSDPLKVGNNSIAIGISDNSNKPVTDVEIAIYYFMSSMPAMSYETRAELKGTKYVAVIKPTMPGAWDAVIKVIAGKVAVQKVMISFNVK